jgi:hypothetical protein
VEAENEKRGYPTEKKNPTEKKTVRECVNGMSD